MAKLNKKTHTPSVVKSLTPSQRLDVKRLKRESKGERAAQLREERIKRIQAKRKQEYDIKSPIHGMRGQSEKRFRRIFYGGRMKRLREKIQENRRFKAERETGGDWRKTEYKRGRKTGDVKKGDVRYRSLLGAKMASGTGRLGRFAKKVRESKFHKNLLESKWYTKLHK